jgi:hypothetical protein
MRITTTLALALAVIAAAPLAAQDRSAFKPGPVITDFGPHAPVPGVAQLPADTEFAVAFDVATPAAEGSANRGFESAAAYGIKPEDLIPGVEMALSAMTAHALLQQNGFTVNPF